MYKYIPPHEHEWDYTGTEVADDCLTPLWHEYECWNCKKTKRVNCDSPATEQSIYELIYRYL